MRVWRFAEFSDRGHARYGDTFTIRVGGLPTGLLTKDRDVIRRLFTGDPLLKRHGNDLLRPILGDESLLVLEPAEHLARRKLLLPPFHGERVQSYARLMERLAHAELDRLQVGEVVTVQPIAQALTLDVILQAVLGVRDRRDAPAVATDLRRDDHAARKLRAVRAPACAPFALERGSGAFLAPEGRARCAAVRADRPRPGATRRLPSVRTSWR